MSRQTYQTSSAKNDLKEIYMKHFPRGSHQLHGGQVIVSAQWIRAVDFYSTGREFESLTAGHTKLARRGKTCNRNYRKAGKYGCKKMKNKVGFVYKAHEGNQLRLLVNAGRCVQRCFKTSWC